MTDLPEPTDTISQPAARQMPRPAAIGFADPIRWLIAGVKDALAHPGIALFYGICFWLMAYVLGAVFRHKPEYSMIIVSGCLLVGPFLAMGLYDVSRRIECGLRPALSASITCWDQHLGSMGMLVLVLIVLELLWGRASLVVFADHQLGAVSFAYALVYWHPGGRPCFRPRHLARLPCQRALGNG